MPDRLEPAIGRPQPENAAQRRRNPDRSVGVGAEGQRRERGRDRRRRSARGAAGDPRRIMRIARRPVMGVLGREAVGVFVHVERADQDRARGGKPSNKRRVANRRRALFVDARAGDGRQSRDVVEVLDRERHAGQRPEIVAPPPGPRRAPPRRSARARSSRR